MSDDAQAAEKVALTDAEVNELYRRWQQKVNFTYMLAAVERIVAARVADAVDRERAAWATKIEALADDWFGGSFDDDTKATGLRALLAADDTEAKGCVCASQWISSGGGCMCWPQEES